MALASRAGSAEALRPSSMILLAAIGADGMLPSGRVVLAAPPRHTRACSATAASSQAPSLLVGLGFSRPVSPNGSTLRRRVYRTHMHNKKNMQSSGKGRRRSSASPGRMRPGGLRMSSLRPGETAVAPVARTTRKTNPLRGPGESKGASGACWPNASQSLRGVGDCGKRCWVRPSRPERPPARHLTQDTPLPCCPLRLRSAGPRPPRRAPPSLGTHPAVELAHASSLCAYARGASRGRAGAAPVASPGPPQHPPSSRLNSGRRTSAPPEFTGFGPGSGVRVKTSLPHPVHRPHNHPQLLHRFCTRASTARGRPSQRPAPP